MIEQPELPIAIKKLNNLKIDIDKFGDEYK